MKKIPTKKVWIDTDPAYGDKNGDCDDGYCMLALLHSENIEVLGISAVFGNTDVNNAYAKLEYLRDHFYHELRIRKGADNPIALNNHKKLADTIPTPTNDAVIAMAATFSQLDRRELITIIAIGALTNVATFLLLYPQYIDKIESIIVVAGRNSEQQEFKFGTNDGGIFRDLNFDVDPIAFNVLLNAPVKIVFAGVEVAKTMWIYEEDMDNFIANGEPDIQYMAKSSYDWLALWQSFGNEVDTPSVPIHGFNPFDLFAGAFAINSDWFIGEYRLATTPVFKDDNPKLGENVFKPYLLAPPETAIKTPTSKRKEITLSKKSGVVYYLQTVTPNFKQEMVKLLLNTEVSENKT